MVARVPMDGGKGVPSEQELLAVIGFDPANFSSASAEHRGRVSTRLAELSNWYVKAPEGSSERAIVRASLAKLRDFLQSQ